jgi:hypothetical protein
MKYKIQMCASGGWADLKESTDGGESYDLCLYDTKTEAQQEVDDLNKLEEDAGVTSGDTYRIVPEHTPQQTDIYE